MNCRTARRLFSAYWDDEVTQAEREHLEKHFGTCTDCRGRYESLARTLEAMATMPREEAAPDLEQRVLAAVRRTRPAPDLLPEARPTWVVATAAAALLAAAVLVGYQLGSAPRTRLVAERGVPAESAPATTTEVADAPATGPAPDGQLAAVPDSLFDHGADVEFILDPVVMYKGRPRPVSGMLPVQDAREQVIITF
jgi:predicted anti-sigma-YlaC factor YlaD